MTEAPIPSCTFHIEPSDVASDFSCGKHPLDDYFRRHALRNHEDGIGRAYVLRKAEHDASELPAVLGYYTLSMALISSSEANQFVSERLPRYPMPVALIGRLAVDSRARGRRIGERLLVDALRRVVDAADIVGCLGVVVDAKDAEAESFYEKYDFTALERDSWPRRLFLPTSVARAAFLDE